MSSAPAEYTTASLLALSNLLWQTVGWMCRMTTPFARYSYMEHWWLLEGSPIACLETQRKRIGSFHWLNQLRWKVFPASRLSERIIPPSYATIQRPPWMDYCSDLRHSPNVENWTTLKANYIQLLPPWYWSRRVGCRSVWMQIFTSGMGMQNSPTYLGILKSSNTTGSKIGWLYFLRNWLDNNILDTLLLGTKFSSCCHIERIVS